MPESHFAMLKCQHQASDSCCYWCFEETIGEIGIAFARQLIILGYLFVLIAGLVYLLVAKQPPDFTMHGHGLIVFQVDS